MRVTMRVFHLDIETVPDFDYHSTNKFARYTYVYMGIDGEHAPKATTTVIIHPSANDVKDHAFYDCRSMTQCISHNTVETIEE
mmetsp:Transcript_3038/g.3486  ORF Transcript_3038/g.3486 Transcript_3038/m.3486 type:complete len:83 (+) Transcript_3038:291-539(+)